MIPPSAESVIASALLFTTQPSDRALTGREPHDEAETELEEIREWVA